MSFFFYTSGLPMPVAQNGGGIGRAIQDEETPNGAWEE
jgi:hypothetical protein